MAIAVLPAIAMLKAIVDFGATLKLSQMMTVSSDASPPAGMTSVHGVAYCTVHGPFCSSAFAAPLAFRLACCVGDLFYYFLLLLCKRGTKAKTIITVFYQRRTYSTI